MDKNDYGRQLYKIRIRYGIVFALMLILLAFMVVWNINSGNVHIEVKEIITILLGGNADSMEYSIIWKIRLPRILMAAILGGALALAGFLLQTFFANPIAGPFVLGISSGAKMAVALTMIFFLQYVGNISSWGMILAAFAGSLIAVGFILLLSRKLKNMATLLVAGIMIGYICSAITDFVVTFAEDSDIVNLHSWSQGSFSGMSMANVKMAAFVVALCLVGSLALAKPMGAYQMGEAYAQSVGVNTKRFRSLLILISSLLAATVTAFAGPISFVGIAVPYLIRRALKTSKPLVVIPGTFLGGAVFCMACDLIARMAFAPTELNISTVTSMLGAPIVILMMIRRKTSNS